MHAATFLSLLVTLSAVAPAQGQLFSPTYRAECTFVVPGADEVTSASFESLTVVGGVTSGELSSGGFSSSFTVLCIDPGPVGCGTTLCADCDLSGQITVLDALLSAQHAVGLVTLVGVQFANCDVDADSDVDVLDSLRIAQFAAGLPAALSCC